MMKRLLINLITILCSYSASFGASHPATGCYWQWMNGNISKEGITKDLEYMKAAGIESAFIFDVGVGVEKGSVDYGSPEWIEAVRHACKEAKRLGITLGIHNAPGYTATGGPWIKPEESMKEITWSVSSKKTPPVPAHKHGFYKDLKIFRTNTADEMQTLGCRLEKDSCITVTLAKEKPLTGFNLWRGERETPLDPYDGPRDYAPRITVEASTDGMNWQNLGTASGPALKARDIPIHFSCPATGCRFLRLRSNRGTNLDRIEILTAEGSGKSFRRVGYTTNGQTVTAAPDAGVGLEVDKLSRKGIEAHFGRFLRPMLDSLSEYCGNTLAYIVIDSWEAGSQDWTESLGTEYLTEGEGRDFVNGALYRSSPTKQRLFMEEYVMPLKEMIAPYGLKLAGEPYGNGDFDRKTYASAFDLPMSEYWARCHYGTIERPLFVSRYAHSAGRDVIGCEAFTAYPGDADIAPTLGSFREDVDKLCNAGVNYFVLHCVAHQDSDKSPRTMGPFGTRFDRAHANVDSVRALTDYIRSRIELQKHRVTFDYSCGDEGQKAYLRLPKGHKEVKALLYCHQNMTEEVLFRSELFCSRMDSLGVAMAFVQGGSQNWDVADGCRERFEAIIKDFASGTEHPELASVPVIPFGHSAQATFPWNFAAWNPERTLCIISFHGDAPRTNLCGYGRANIEWGRTRNIDRIPGLMIEGEYEWWEARVRPALAFRMMYPDSRISFLCDAGRGHFDLCEATQDYMARFIAKALADPRPDGGVYYSRWMEDGSESTDPHDMFWYQDEEMAALTKARYEATRGKKMQYVSARLGGKLLPYDANSHIKISADCPAGEFTVEPVFTDENRSGESNAHASVRPRVVLISGPAIQTGEYTFRFDPDYFGDDPKRLWAGITICVEADGDDSYKPAVQEIRLFPKQAAQP
ncbi:MAG: hypothetical protein NC418_10925 [Muribaculaceae bacterium]|nr:hypothetical protein [Muribaculaceae bacterium]